MTDRQALARALELANQHGKYHFAAVLQDLLDTLPPDPPDTEMVEVRIAVCVEDNGFVYARAIDTLFSETGAIEDVEYRSKGQTVIAKAIITARIPRRVVPIVEGKVAQ